MHKGIEQSEHEFDGPDVPGKDGSDPKKFERMDTADIPADQRVVAERHLENKAASNEAMLRAANINTDNSLRPNREEREGEARQEARDKMEGSLDSLGLNEWRETEDPQKSLNQAIERTRQYEVQLDNLGNVGEHSSTADVRDFEQGPDKASQ